LAHYLSATHILGPDGSPFHLVNFTGRWDVNVGIIQRRPGHDAAQMANQGALYGLQKVNVLSHLGQYWGNAGDHRAGLSLTTELKFSSLCQELKEREFIGQDANWSDLSEAELTSALEENAKLAEADLRPVASAHTSLSEFPRCEIEGSPQVFFADS